MVDTLAEFYHAGRRYEAYARSWCGRWLVTIYEDGTYYPVLQKVLERTCSREEAAVKMLKEFELY